MYLGRIVEQGDPDRSVRAPRASLYAGAGLGDPGARRAAAASRIVLPGDPPNPVDAPAGCAFHPRCPRRRRALPRSRRRRCAPLADGRQRRLPSRDAGRKPDAGRRLMLRYFASRICARGAHHRPRRHLRLRRAAAVGRSGADHHVGRRAARSDRGLPQGLGPRPSRSGCSTSPISAPSLHGRSRPLHARRPAGDPARARAHPGDAGDHRAGASCSSSCIGIPAGIYAALHRNSADRPRRDDGGGRGLHRAELRAGAGAGAGLRGAARLAAVRRAGQLAHAILPIVTLGVGGAGDPGALHPLGDAGGAGPALYPHRLGQGPALARGRDRACAAQCGDPDRRPSSASWSAP